jgi:hypothetical protein
MGFIDTTFHLNPNAIMGPHTHPIGQYAGQASRADWSIFDMLTERQAGAGLQQQKSAVIVPQQGPVFKFNQDYLNTGRQIPYGPVR